MKGIQDIESVAGKRVLVRISTNVPIHNGEVSNDFRLRSVLPTITQLQDRGARVILLGHLGRDGETLKPVYEYLKQKLNLTFIEDTSGEKTQRAVSTMSDGDVILLENLRKDSREVANDDTFAKELASLGDIYVNEDFAVSHREHASIVGVPKYLPSYAGLHFQKEVAELSKAREPLPGSLFIIGGAKFETKLPLIEKFSDVYETVIITGALANNFFDARGYETGTSLVAKNIDISHLLSKEHIHTPVDVVVSKGKMSETKKPEEVKEDEKIVDAGQATVASITDELKKASSVVWNGPLGEYESGFSEGTKALAEAIANSNCYSIIGGGDTVAAIAELGIEDKISFISTAGGAMLTFLEEGTLPGIEVIN